MKRFVVPLLIALIMISMILVSCSEKEPITNPSPESSSNETGEVIENDSTSSLGTGAANTTTKKGNSTVYYPTYSPNSSTQNSEWTKATSTTKAPETFVDPEDEQFTYEDPESWIEDPDEETDPNQENPPSSPEKPTVTTSKKPPITSGGSLQGPSIDKGWGIPTITIPPIQIPSVPELPSLPSVKR